MKKIQIILLLLLFFPIVNIAQETPSLKETTDFIKKKVNQYGYYITIDFKDTKAVFVHHGQSNDIIFSFYLEDVEISKSKSVVCESGLNIKFTCKKKSCFKVKHKNEELISSSNSIDLNDVEIGNRVYTAFIHAKKLANKKEPF
ncbi:MAG: hypothetical protein KAS07_05775 [Candidatus Pacebacteria bacterium]|nr:hypothetical protein [Candidatus Paceibacterota bacterium]